MPFLSIKLELVTNLFCFMFTHIQEIDSVYTFFNMNYGNIFKFYRCLCYIIATIAKIWSITKVLI